MIGGDGIVVVVGGGVVAVVILGLQNCVAFLFIEPPWKYQMGQSRRQNLIDKTTHALFS